jgi:peptidoglycan/xylan/chitin deacetylase (PgdA/CDA1 family)
MRVCPSTFCFESELTGTRIFTDNLPVVKLLQNEMLRFLYGYTRSVGMQNEISIRKICKNKLLTVTCFHSVAEKSNVSNPVLNIKLFRKYLDFVTKHYEVTTFRNLTNLKHVQKPALILSFDDGYQNFIEFVAPEIENRGIVVNLNIIPKSIESGKPPINVLVQDFIGTAPRELIENLKVPMYKGKLFDGDRMKFGLNISHHLKNLQIIVQEEIYSFLESQLFNFQEFEFTKMLTLSEIQEVMHIVELGAHSYSHATMSLESDEYFEMDLLNCINYFRYKLDYKTNIYAFPNGAFKDSQIRMAQKAGFDHILLTEEDFSTARSNVHPRFVLYGNSMSEIVLRSQGRWRKPLSRVR